MAETATSPATNAADVATTAADVAAEAVQVARSEVLTTAKHNDRGYDPHRPAGAVNRPPIHLLLSGQ